MAQAEDTAARIMADLREDPDAPLTANLMQRVSQYRPAPGEVDPFSSEIYWKRADAYGTAAVEKMLADAKAARQGSAGAPKSQPARHLFRSLASRMARTTAGR